MKETGILFTPENIRLVMSGVKNQTRRVLNPQPESNAEGGALVPLWPACHYGYIGDLLYVKEGIICHASIPQLVGYYLDGCRVTEEWEARRTAMFMPKWAARTWLELTDIRIERLQNISEEDAKAEGAECLLECGCDDFFHDGDVFPRSYRLGYRKLWDSINRKKHPWKDNPWVWVLGFRKL